MEGTAITVSAVLFQEADGTWSAQCLEYDIAAQAKTITDLRYEFERVLTVHLAASVDLEQQPFEGLKPAPQKFWDMYQNSELSVQGKRLPFRVPLPASMPMIVPELRIA
jgi:predicted RNase H-like HicB family nuclease